MVNTRRCTGEYIYTHICIDKKHCMKVILGYNDEDLEHRAQHHQTIHYNKVQYNTMEHNSHSRSRQIYINISNVSLCDTRVKCLDGRHKLTTLSLLLFMLH